MSRAEQRCRIWLDVRALSEVMSTHDVATVNAQQLGLRLAF